jgi:hypothetical protein
LIGSARNERFAAAIFRSGRRLPSDTAKPIAAATEESFVEN